MGMGMWAQMWATMLVLVAWGIALEPILWVKPLGKRLALKRVRSWGRRWVDLLVSKREAWLDQLWETAKEGEWDCWRGPQWEEVWVPLTALSLARQ